MRLTALTLSLSLLLASSLTQAANLSPNDIAWLRRDSFGLNSATVAQYRALGRNTLLTKQLNDQLDDTLPAPITAQIDNYDAFHTPLDQLLGSLQQEQQQLRSIPDGPEKQAANQAIQQRGNQIGLQAQQAELLHAIYGPN